MRNYDGELKVDHNKKQINISVNVDNAKSSGQTQPVRLPLSNAANAAPYSAPIRSPLSRTQRRKGLQDLKGGNESLLNFTFKKSKFFESKNLYLKQMD